MIKQPELGKKIAELRKAKGLTQEELVEKCNISVRTIQRIETGEVMPRSYTIKTILAVLGYDFGKMVAGDLEKTAGQDYRASKPISTWLRELMFLDVDLARSSDSFTKQLNLAWIFGIIYFILTFLEAPVEYWRFEKKEMLIGTPAYVVLKIFLLISFVFFQRGFIMIGGLFGNYLLQIISLIAIGAHVLIAGYDMVSIFYDSVDPKVVLLPASLLFGVIGIVYGISLRRLENWLGRPVKFAAASEIIAGCLFLTVVLSFVGDIVHVVAELLEIIIIFKTIEIIKIKKQDSLA